MFLYVLHSTSHHSYPAFYLFVCFCNWLGGVHFVCVWFLFVCCFVVVVLLFFFLERVLLFCVYVLLLGFFVGGGGGGRGRGVM